LIGTVKSRNFSPDAKFAAKPGHARSLNEINSRLCMTDNGSPAGTEARHACGSPAAEARHACVTARSGFSLHPVITVCFTANAYAAGVVSGEASSINPVHRSLCIIWAKTSPANGG
jgi:hypothetical protein